MDHFTIPHFPPEPLWEVPVEPTAAYPKGRFRVRALTAEGAVRRARTIMGLTPTDEPRLIIEEDDDG